MAGEMALWLKALTAQADDLNWIHGKPVVEDRTDYYKLCSDFHMSTVGCVVY